MNTKYIKIVAILFIGLIVGISRMSAQTINSTQWLQQQTLPVFKVSNTLPKLDQLFCGIEGAYPTAETRAELARHYGYAVTFSSNPKFGTELRNLCITNPEVFKVTAAFHARVSSKAAYNWPEGSFLSNGDFSPEMPDEAWQHYIDEGIASIEKQLVNIPASGVANLQNWAEAGLGTPYDWDRIATKNPSLLAAKGNKSWVEYISERKGYYDKKLRDAIKIRWPNALYTVYGYGGLEQSGDEEWRWDFKLMKDATDLAANEEYFNYFNTGFAGNNDMFKEMTHARYDEIKNGSPHFYPWLSAGYERKISQYQGEESQGKFADLSLWMGFLKMNYVAGMLGGTTTGEFNCDLNTAATFDATSPPKWLDQMAVLAHTHALFSWLEPVLRNSDLLEGPYRHKWNSSQPAYEFTQDNAKVMVRRTKNRDQWLVGAWAMDGVEQNVTVTIPDFGEYTIQARSCGTVFLIEKKGKVVTSKWYDKNGMYPSLTASQVDGPYTQLTGISVDKYIPIQVGKTKKLTAVYHPANATNKSVVWSSSNTSIATVSTTGLVKRLAPGSANIIATDQERGYKAIFQLTVPVHHISLDITSKVVSGTGSQLLKATILPDDATNKTISWSSANPAVAKVNSSGIVTFTGVGSTTIAAMSDDYEKLSATCQVTVNDLHVNGLKLNSTLIEVGKTISLSPSFSPGNVFNKNVRWSESSDAKVMTVGPKDLTSCKITALAPGTASITATSLDGEKIATTAITVVESPPGRNFLLVQNAGKENNMSGTVGYEFTLQKEASIVGLGRFTNEKLKNSHEIQLWNVSEKRVIASVTITDASPRDASEYQYEKLANPVTLKNGTTCRLVSAEKNGGDTWKPLGIFPQHMSIAKINFGVTGTEDLSSFPSIVAPGAMAEQGYGAPTFYWTTVKDDGIVLNKSASELVTGKSEQLIATDFRQTVALQPPLWTSSDNSIATVTSSGLVTRLAVGSVTITVTTFDNQYSATCKYK